MLVTEKNFDQALSLIDAAAKRDKALSYDTEFTCLHWWDTPWYKDTGVAPRIFSVQFATKDTEFYFDFEHSDDKLSSEHFLRINTEITQNPDVLWFGANIKIDLHHSRNHGIEFAGRIHCTQAAARVMNNNEPSLSLDHLSKTYLGAGKFMDMAAFAKEKGFFTKIKKFGYNEKFDEILHFEKIDLALMCEYGKMDVRRTFDLARFQINKILELDEQIYSKLPAQHDGRRIKLQDVLDNEHRLTKILFEMEQQGVLIDRRYTEEAYEHEVREYRRIESELDGLGKAHSEAKIDWNSPKQLKPIFEALGEPYGYTEKGNASFDKSALEDSHSPVAALILDYRFHYKRAHTYFENFIWLADSNNVIHADAQQAGTAYGRMSYWAPNLQNVPKKTDKEETGTKVRRCFIPRPGKLFVDIDYKGAEYYMSMDYAREMPVVEELKAGLDPHKRLAAEMGIASRDDAKTMQFRILYGGGGGVVGRALGYKGEEAERIGKQKKKLYFQRVPALAAVIRQVGGGWFNGARVVGVAESRGYIFNWLGRLLRYAPSDSYKAFNGLIQGGVGDMTKKAMVEIDSKVLSGAMRLQIHDALLFEMDREELKHIPEIIKTMTDVYPHKVLPMSADAGYSDKSWADLQSEIPPVA